MGAPKGTDNFKSCRDAKVATNLLTIRDALARMRKRKNPYSKLSFLVADLVERTGICRTTFKRNPIYEREILAYFASQPGVCNVVSDRDASSELLQAKLIDMRMEIASLGRQIDILRKRNCSRANEPFPVKNISDNQHEWYLAFNNTAVTLKLLIERLNEEFETIHVNLDTGEISELAAAASRQVISSGERTRAFVELYRNLLIQEGKYKDKRK